jgi:ligand-binding sensor domain-containing protein/signal transduction histidine kinase
MMPAVGPLPAPAYAERPPTRLFTTADGLPSDDVVKIRRDSQGFLWFATSEGVSRFDGVQFVTYGRRHGLPVAAMNDIIEGRDGHIWIATNGGGVVRLNPLPGSDGALFTVVPVGPDRASNRVNVLLEDEAGRFWAGTDSGLYRCDEPGSSSFVPVALGVPGISDRLVAISSISLGTNKDVWLATSQGVIQVPADGPPVRHRGASAMASPPIVVTPDRKGRIWIGSTNGLAAFREPHITSSAIDGVEWRPAELPATEIRAIHVAQDGHLWIGALDGRVWEYDGATFRSRLEPGDSAAPLNSLTSDAEGNTWIAARPGALRIARNGLVSFDQRDGLAPGLVKAFAQEPDGVLYALSRGSRINRWDGGRFTSARPPLPLDVRPPSWSNQADLRDSQGYWWVGSGQGLYRYRSGGNGRGPLSFESVALYTTRDGLPGDDISALFEDRDGNIWIAATSAIGDELARWERRTGAFRRFSLADGVPQFSTPIAFAQDRAGAIWIGLRAGGLLRYRASRFELFGAADGISGPTPALYVDKAGRLWVGLLEGVARIDRPAADRITVRRYSSANGLASDAVRGFAEDRFGRIYFGTSRGVNRLDLESGAIEHYTTSDGLISLNILAVHADREGDVWFATPEGLSRLTPAPDPPPVAPTVRIANVRIAGVRHPLSEFGAARIDGVRLGPSENNVEVDFFGLAHGSRGALRYQFQLEGSTPTWSEPSDQRTVNFASLASGSYRLLVRAVSAAGVPSVAPAELLFTVLPPIYARWWFITLAATLAAGAGVALYRMRVAQLVRVERVRARIATDLHDDIGASLSQIAILAEVARQRAGAQQADPAVADPLLRIADTSRGLVDSMSDIVWAINPAADSLSDLIHRMRRFAEDTLSADEIELVFRAEEPRVDIKLGADLRREVFLVLKESVTNIAKHAGCTRVEIDFERNRRRLGLRVSDNGNGFDSSRRSDGNGLRSMRQRAAAMGGRLDVQATPTGTTITLDVDMTHAMRLTDDEGAMH